MAIDGSDGFHAITLQTISQSAADIDRQGGVPLADRRVQIVTTNHGVRGISVDLQGNPIGHGHFAGPSRPNPRLLGRSAGRYGIREAWKAVWYHWPSFLSQTWVTRA